LQKGAYCQLFILHNKALTGDVNSVATNHPRMVCLLKA